MHFFTLNTKQPFHRLRWIFLIVLTLCASQYQATRANNDLTRSRRVRSPSQGFCREQIDTYIHIRCSAEEKRRPKLADSIKMLIPPARIVQTFVPRCLFLVSPSFVPLPPCSPSRTVRSSRISLMRLLADRVSPSKEAGTSRDKAKEIRQESIRIVRRTERGPHRRWR